MIQLVQPARGGARHLATAPDRLAVETLHLLRRVLLARPLGGALPLPLGGVLPLPPLGVCERGVGITTCGVEPLGRKHELIAHLLRRLDECEGAVACELL